MRPDADILIRDYFNQRLDQNGINEYEQLYSHDAKFKTLADQMGIEMTGIRMAARKDLKNKFASWETAQAEKQDRWHLYKYMGIGAVVILAISVTLFKLLPTSNEDLFLAYYEPYQNFEYTTTRDETNDSLSIRAKAFAAYDAGDHESAKLLFSRLLVENPDDMAVLFFRGASQLKLGWYEQSLQDFQQVAGSKDAYYKEDATWYLALIYVKTDQVKSAKTELRKLTGSETYQTRVNLLLREMK